MAEQETSRSGHSEENIIATPEALVITLSEKQQAAARACLERSGKVTFSLKEVSVTELPTMRRGISGLFID